MPSSCHYCGTWRARVALNLRYRDVPILNLKADHRLRTSAANVELD
jgi:hypothetical protein